MWYFKNGGQKTYYLISVIIILVGITTSGMYLTDYICRDKGYHHIYNEEGMGFGYISGAEYLIEGTRQEDLGYAVPITGADIEIVDYRKEYLHIEMNCVNHGDTEGYIDLPLLLYKGYHAYDNDSGKELEIVYGSNNLVRVVLPIGYEGEVHVNFESPFYWRIAEVVTYGWYIFWLVYALIKRRKNRFLSV